MTNKIYVSPTGLQKLHAELAAALSSLDTLKKEKSLAYTSSGDTWHDNPYFNKLQQDEEALARRVVELQATVSQAQIFSLTIRNTRQVRLGSIVRFYRRQLNSQTETIETWEIVGFGETDVSAKRMAYNAPLAWDLLGMEPGEIKDALGATGPVEYEIIELYAAWDDVPPS